MHESEKSEKSVEINKEMLYYINKVDLPFIYTQKDQLSYVYSLYSILCVWEFAKKTKNYKSPNHKYVTGFSAILFTNTGRLIEE